MKNINLLLNYCLEKKIITKRDIIYYQNQLLYFLNSSANFVFEEVDVNVHIDDLLDEIVLKYFLKKDEFLKSKIISILMENPSNLEKRFFALKTRKESTDFFYQYCKDVNYIKERQINKNIKYVVKTEYGKLDITINCARAEKDPKDIMKVKENENLDSYIKCALCLENEGFYGGGKYLDRANHRMIKLLLNGNYYLQYSPYSYFCEHAIIINENHEDMVINLKTIQNLILFVKEFPHYFIGSNADLPIVGGSLLTHDHYQAGVYEFALQRASSLKTFECENMQIDVLHWPLSCIKLRSNSESLIVDYVMLFLNHWRTFSNKDIICFSDAMHNTITPILRMVGSIYELIIVFRNNRCTLEYPDGIFHPHVNKHHVKKENIGLIEVMGLAVLPERLIKIKDEVISCIKENKELSSRIHDFKDIYEKIKNSANLDEAFDQEIGKVFLEVLKDCGVFSFEELIEYVDLVLQSKKD